MEHRHKAPWCKWYHFALRQKPEFEFNTLSSAVCDWALRCTADTVDTVDSSCCSVHGRHSSVHNRHSRQLSSVHDRHSSVHGRHSRQLSSVHGRHSSVHGRHGRQLMLLSVDHWLYGPIPLPPSHTHTHTHTHIHSLACACACRFAWRVGPLVYHGELMLSIQNHFSHINTCRFAWRVGPLVYHIEFSYAVYWKAMLTHNT